MAGSGPQRFAKRQRELRKRAKREAKRAERAERKARKADAEPGGGDPDLEGIVPGPQPHTPEGER